MQVVRSRSPKRVNCGSGDVERRASLLYCPRVRQRGESAANGAFSMRRPLYLFLTFAVALAARRLRRLERNSQPPGGRRRGRRRDAGHEGAVPVAHGARPEELCGEQARVPEAGHDRVRAAEGPGGRLPGPARRVRAGGRRPRHRRLGLEGRQAHRAAEEAVLRRRARSATSARSSSRGSPRTRPRRRSAPS